MDHGDLGDVLQRQRPVHRGVAAAGDHHALAAKILAPADVVLHRAAGLVGGQALQRRPVGAERAGAGGDDHRFGADGVALVGGQREAAALAAQAVDLAAEQPRHGERGDLLFQLGDQRAGLDRRVGRDVVDRLLRIQRGALAADLGQRVDQHAGQLQHAQFENGEQPDRARADDRHVGFDVLCHARPIRRFCRTGPTQGQYRDSRYGRVAANEGGRLTQCGAAFGQDCRKELPDMRQPRPDPQFRLHAGLPGVFDHAARIVQQDFGVAHLDQQGRQAGQIGIKRRDKRICRRRVSQIMLCGLANPGSEKQGVGVVVVDDACPRGGQVGPGREQHGAGRQRLIGVPQGDQKRKSEAAAGRIASDHDVAGRYARGDQRTIGRERILERRRKGMFRRQAIIEGEQARIAPDRQA